MLKLQLTVQKIKLWSFTELYKICKPLGLSASNENGREQILLPAEWACYNRPMNHIMQHGIDVNVRSLHHVHTRLQLQPI